MINCQEPSICDVIVLMDGVSFKSECTSERVIQNAFYDGNECDTAVNNVFAYGPDGNFFLCTELPWELGEQYFDSKIPSTY